MSAVKKAEVLARVTSSGLPKRKVLRELGVPKSTYYRWLRWKDQQELEDDTGGGKTPWNRLTSWEVDNVLSAAMEMPELSCRQLVASPRSPCGVSAITSSRPISLRSVGFHSAWPCASFAMHRRLITQGKSGCPSAISDSVVFLLGGQSPRQTNLPFALLICSVTSADGLPCPSLGAALLHCPSTWSRVCNKHVWMFLHLFHERAVVSDCYDPKPVVPQLSADLRVRVLLPKSIVMRSVHEDANTW